MMMLNRIRNYLRRPLRTLSSEQAYLQWAATYPAVAHNRLMVIEQEAMLALLPPLEGRTVLDLACGTGRYGLIAKERGAGQVTGMDQHFAMLAQATLPQLAQAPMDALPLRSSSVDVVLCGMAFGHLPQIAAAMKEICRVLRDGGVLLLSDFHPFQYLRGAQRTFTAADGRTYAVEHYMHLYADYFNAAQPVGLRITGVREPTLPEGDDAPIVLVLRLQKEH